MNPEPSAFRLEKALSMDRDTPLATLRLAGDLVDGKDANRLLLVDGALTDVKSKPGIWMVTTEGYRSPDPQDHLDRLIKLAETNIASLRDAIPHLSIAFSLLVFDAAFSPQTLAPSSVAAATALGTLVIELPAQGRELVFNGDTMLEYAA